MAKLKPAWRNRIVGHGEEAPDQLLANPRNWRLHPKQQQDVLGGVLDSVGFVQSIIVNQRSGFVVDGHARVALAISKHQPTVPVVYVELDDHEEALILATLDPISAMAGRDDELLASLIQDVQIEQGPVSDLLASLAGEQPRTDLHDDDADLTPPVEPITKPGDLWLLGTYVTCPDCGHDTDV